jgi:imidazoleglycerol-phosphate dehydratase
MRIAEIERNTSETKIKLSVNLDGTGKYNIKTGSGFFDHMLNAFSKHSLIDLDIVCEGDTWIDPHHTVEDVSIALGLAIKQALGDKKGIRRYADAKAPLDESLTSAVVDVSGRPYFVWTLPSDPKFDAFDFASIPIGETREGSSFKISQENSSNSGSFTGSLLKHTLESLVTSAGFTAHIEVVRGGDLHHICEASYKSLALAVRAAIEDDPRRNDVPSTKGSL